MIGVAQEEFRSAIRAAGLNPPEVITGDGRLHRFASNGTRTDDSGWYVFHDDDSPAGAFGDWRSDVSEKWRADNGREWTPAEKALHRTRMAAIERERKVDAARRHAEAATKATTLWTAATACSTDHPYLVRKRVTPVATMREIASEEATRVLGYAPQARGELLAGRLLVVPIKVGSKVASLELIDEAGRKTALAGGAKRGGYWAAQQMPDSTGRGAGCTLLIGEGVATVLSAMEATGHPSIAALSCNNLALVARAMRERYPLARIVVLADLGNGEAAAEAAARATGALLAKPSFGTEQPECATDFNDLTQCRGAGAVQQAVARAMALVDHAGREWPDPQPLPDGLAQVEAFDLAMLPDCLRAWVGDIADRVQCPPDFVAVAAVAVMGSVLGRKLAIRPQAQTDWAEVSNQWGLVIGRPGVLKSPAIEQAMAPVRRLEATARERFAAAQAAFRADEKATKLRTKVRARDAEKLLHKNLNADVSNYLRDDDEADEEPRCKRYTTSDTSVESLAELVRLNPNGLLVHRDEMMSLLRDLDREERAGARGFYLSGWNGSTSYTVDRIGRGLDLHIPAVCLSMLGGTQPARIADYVHAANHGGRGDDGLIQRFGLMVWPDMSSDWKNVDRWPDSPAKRNAFEVFVKLDELDHATVGAIQDEGFDRRPEGLPYLRFAGDALGEFVDWRGDLERRLRSGELAPALESHLAKYRKLVPSLALLFHVADGNTGPVGRRPLQRALAWSSYLESHARRVYGSGPASEAAAARAILGRIRKGDLPTEFSSRDVWRPCWAGLADIDVVAKGLATLVDFDHLCVSKVETAGRTATRYQVNPKAMT